MSDYEHGAESKELKSSVLVVNATSAGIAYVVGTAPINTVDPTNVNIIQRITNEDEANEIFGFDKDYATYSLCEATDIFFTKYKVAPVYMLNVLNPEKHKKSAAPESVTQINRQGILSTKGTIASSVGIKVATVAKEINVDYTLAFNSDNLLVVTTLETGTIKANDILDVTYDILDPSKVKVDDIVSGIKQVTDIYLEHNEVISSLTAPRWSHETEVINALLAEAKSLSEQYTANALIDLDTSKIKVYSDAVGVKAKAGIIDPLINLCLGDVYIDDKQYTHSLYLAALKQYIAADNDNVPNQNPSNKIYLGINGYYLNGKKLLLTKKQAEYLNGNGIIVCRNLNGWRCWGNRTACYPGNTDPKDFDIAIRDMGNWLLNNIIILTEQSVDGQMDRAWILRVQQTIQGWLDGLIGRDKLISGTYTLPLSRNPLNDIANGKIRFKLSWCTAGTASVIITESEFNVNDLTKPLEDAQ